MLSSNIFYLNGIFFYWVIYIYIYNIMSYLYSILVIWWIIVSLLYSCLLSPLFIKINFVIDFSIFENFPSFWYIAFIWIEEFIIFVNTKGSVWPERGCLLFAFGYIRSLQYFHFMSLRLYF